MTIPTKHVDEAWISWQLRQVPPELMTDRQRLAHQYLGESYYNLILYRDSLQRLRGTIRIDPKAGPNPTAEQQQLLFNARRDFSNAFYASMEAMMGFFTRVPLQGLQPPRRSVTAFNKWLSSLEHTVAPMCVEFLERERVYRTALTHSAELPPFDWMTVSTHEDPTLHIRLFGHGEIPKIASANDTSFPGDWDIESQDEANLCAAYSYVFLLLMGLASAEFADAAGAYE